MKILAPNLIGDEAMAASTTECVVPTKYCTRAELVYRASFYVVFCPRGSAPRGLDYAGCEMLLPLTDTFSGVEYATTKV